MSQFLIFKEECALQKLPIMLLILLQKKRVLLKICLKVANMLPYAIFYLRFTSKYRLCLLCKSIGGQAAMKICVRTKALT